jgi:SPP1 gp7 family putative phage head morphogenesis protein
VSGAASAEAIGLPFDEAIAFFRRKLSVPTPRWDTLWRDQHAAAFTVAGAMSADLLADLRASVDKALAEGGTLAEFRREFDAIVQRHGWRHKGKPGWRARTIFETNLRTAYAAGSWQQAQDTKAERPFLRYSAILDNRTRPLHRRWHGTILPIDHPFWRTHYPPNGWGCRCTVITLSQAQLDARGWRVTDPAPASGGVPRRVRQPDGTERIEEVPPGVDPAWAYNVGEANLRWRAARVMADKLAAAPPDLATVVMAAVNRAGGEAAATREDLHAEFDAWAARSARGEATAAGDAERVAGALVPLAHRALSRALNAPPKATPAVLVLRAEDVAAGATLARQLPALVATAGATLLEAATGDVLLVVAAAAGRVLAVRARRDGRVLRLDGGRQEELPGPEGLRLLSGSWPWPETRG